MKDIIKTGIRKFKCHLCRTEFNSDEWHTVSKVVYDKRGSYIVEEMIDICPKCNSIVNG